MFESALLSTGAAPRRRIALPVSIALHAATVLAIVGASVWREQELAPPSIPIVWTAASRAAPPPAGSPSGTVRLPDAVAPPRHASVPAAVSADPLPASPAPESGEAILDDEGIPGLRFGFEDGEIGGRGSVIGAPPNDDSGIGSGGREAPLVPGGDGKSPELLFRVDPEYPEVARQARVQGVVVLQAIIGTGGAIEELTVLKSLFPPLDEAALKAVRLWRYRAATLNGRAVRVLLRVTVDFRLH